MPSGNATPHRVQLELVPEHWFGCSHKVVWLALATMEMRNWIAQRRAAG